MPAPRPQPPPARADRREQQRRQRSQREARAARARALRRAVLAAAAVAAIAAGGWMYWRARDPALTDPRTWPAELRAVESQPSEGAEHVSPGTPLRYRSDPPTSGAHYDAVAPARFFDRPVDPGLLVHNLEHGHVVIYYDAQRLPPAALARLRELTARYRGQWDAVLAVPRTDADHPLILTAWTKALRLKEYRPAAIDAFIDAYRGRGPEHPVR